MQYSRVPPHPLARKTLNARRYTHIDHSLVARASDGLVRHRANVPAFHCERQEAEGRDLRSMTMLLPLSLSALCHRRLATLQLDPTLGMMMSPELLGSLARYNRWMNDRLFAPAGALSDEERKRDRVLQI